MLPVRDRIGAFLTRLLDGPSEVRAAAGFSLNVPEYQIGTPRWLDMNIQTYRQAYATGTAVYRCIGARAQAVSSAPVRVYRDEGGDPTELPDHPLRQLMTAPNPMMSEAEFLVMTQTLMDATGFCAIEKVRARAGNVTQLWHLRSDWLQEIKRDQRASDWKFVVPGRVPVIIPAQDIIIIPGGPSTDLGTTGMSPIAVALREVGIDQGLTDFLKLFIEAGGTPRYALVTDQRVRTQEEAEEIRGKFGYTYGGFQNWTKTVLLHGGLDYKVIGSNIEEFAYPQLRALTETHICSVFGVPPIIAGLQAGLDASTYSNYEQARKAFFEDTVQALWARLDGALTRGLLAEFSDDRRISLEFDTSQVKALQEDATALWQRATSALSSGGITLNQFQSLLGLPGFETAGDVLYLSIATQPTRPDDLSLLADQTAEPPQPVPASLPAGSDSGDTATSENTAPLGDGADQTKGMSHVGLELRTVPLETRARIGKANRRQIAKLGLTFTPRLRAMFRKQGEIVAAALQRRSADGHYKPLEASEGLVSRALEASDFDALEALTLRELTALYHAAGEAAFTAAALQLETEIGWDLSNPAIRQTLAQLARRVVEINATTREGIADVVTRGLDDGLTTQQIADNLRGLFTETYRGRALTIARTESQVSYNLATADAYKASGVVMAMQCLDNPDHTDDYGAADGLSCAERNGIITDVDAVDIHIFSEHPNGTLAVSPLVVRPLGAE